MKLHGNRVARQRRRPTRLRPRRLSLETLEGRAMMAGAPYPLAPPKIADITRDRTWSGYNFVLSGQADPWVHINVQQADGRIVAQTTTNAAGQWTATSWQSQLVNGEFRYRVVSHDGGGSFSPPSAGVRYRPNFVLINTDDMAAHDLAHLRRTNNLLVSSGTNFTNAFVPTSLSGPSRASLLTGQYAHNTGVLENSSPLGGEVNLDRSSTMATWLRNAGYDTAAFGKSVTVSEGLESLSPSKPPPGWNQFSTGSHEGYVLFHNGVKSVYDYDDYNSTDLWAGMADSFIRESRPDSKPFLLYLAPTISHLPYQPLPRHLGSMSNVPKWRPPSYNVVPKDVPNRPGIKNAAQWDLQRQRHLETLQAVDEAVAKVYHALSQTGELDNTVFVFTSDNGMMWGEHGLISTKGNFYDESLRVPLVIRDGRAPLAQTAGQMVLNIDIAPTFAGMAGVQLGHRTDGRNIAHVVSGSTAPVRTSFLMQHKWIEGWNYVDQYGRGGVGIRTEYWKYVEYESGKIDLFNLKTDPYEMRNLGADPAFAWARQTLASRLHAQLPADNSGPSVTNLSHSVETTSWGLRYLRVTGEVSDESSGGSQVRSPEFFVDTLGQPGWGRGLDTTDGYFNSSREAFRGRIRLDELSPGMHTIYVRARDVSGNWGQVVSFRFHVATTRSFADPEAETRLTFVPLDWVEDSPTFDGADVAAEPFGNDEESTASNAPPSDAVMAMESELSELWEPITAGEEAPAALDETDLDEFIAAGLSSLE